jgi:hypothetical protein
MSQIKTLVTFAKEDTTNVYKEISLGTTPNFQAQQISANTGVNIKGLEKILTASGIRHAFAGHGNHKLESERGQVGIKDEDFELLPQILKESDSVVKGDNKRGQQSVVFIKKIITNTYHAAFVCTKNNLVFTTMFIKSH